MIMMFVWVVFALLKKLPVGAMQMNRHACAFWKIPKAVGNNISDNNRFHTKTRNNVFIIDYKGGFQ
jgi:hypothetical protein